MAHCSIKKERQSWLAQWQTGQLWQLLRPLCIKESLKRRFSYMISVQNVELHHLSMKRDVKNAITAEPLHAKNRISDYENLYPCWRSGHYNNLGRKTAQKV